MSLAYGIASTVMRSSPSLFFLGGPRSGRVCDFSASMTIRLFSYESSGVRGLST